MIDLVIPLTDQGLNYELDREDELHKFSSLYKLNKDQTSNE